MIFAGLLCALGRKRARAPAPVYPGMMSVERAVRDLPSLDLMFEVPIEVAGVGFNYTSQNIVVIGGVELDQ